MRSRAALTVAALLLLAVGVAGVVWWRAQQDALDAAADAAVTAYVKAWNAKDMSTVAFADAGAAEDFARATEDLGDAPVRVQAPEVVSRDGDTATTDLAVRWTLPGEVGWSYSLPVTVVRSGDRWLVEGQSTGSLWHPALAAGETIELKKTAGRRGNLLDRAGKALMPLGTVYAVQLDPVKATAESAAELERLVDADEGSLTAALDKAQSSDSKAPIPVITYRKSDYTPIKKEIEALRGVIAPASEQPLARTRTFGQPLLGTVGAVTAEMIEKGEGRYAAGDRAGLGGLQRQYDADLAGAPGITIATSAGATLFEQAAIDGSDVPTTLDQSVQAAAEKALSAADLEAPAALVAIDVPTGQVLAAANSPKSGFNRAITGRYPPGSTLKVATTYAYLTRGITTPQTPVRCPPSVTIDGREFRNYSGESVSGTPTFFQDFTVSCNTAFVGLSDKLKDDDLTKAAKSLGIGAGWADRLGVEGAFEGRVPATKKGTDAAAAAIGQGRDEVSPLALAVMAASIGRGTMLPPVLVGDPKAESAQPSPLDGAAVAEIRSMMASVVSSGTGTVLRDTPGEPVRAKTGTAEHGDDPDALPRVWVVGYQDDVAFAVLVEEGTSGGRVAAPIARDFLSELARD